MKIAIVGTGFIADIHARELKAMGRPASVVIGSCTEHAETFREKRGIAEAAADFSRALCDDIDAVHVCTPPDTHFAMVHALLEAGKHVICEKPLCLRADEARRLHGLALEKGTVCAVDFNVRFHDACRRFREKLSFGEAGKPLLIHGSYRQEFHILPAVYSWRYSAEGGTMRAVTEIGSHWIDLARHLTGLEIREVSAAFARCTPERYIKDGVMFAEPTEGGEPLTVSTEDAASISLRFEGGALGSLFLSEISHGSSNDISIEVTGSDATLGWSSEDPYRLKVARLGQTAFETNAFAGGFPQTFTAFFDAVYRDIEEGRPSEAPEYATFRDGLRAAAVCEAIGESAARNAAWIPVR